MAGMVRECKQCGLPAKPGTDTCCYGCELVYELRSSADGEAGSARARVAVCIFFAMNLMAVSTLLYSEDLYALELDHGMLALRTVFRWASAVFATPVLAILGVPMARRAARMLRSGTIGTELLAVTAAVAAYGYSVVSLLRGGAVHFDVACMTLLLIAVGRYLEASSRSRAAAVVGKRFGAQARPTLRLGPRGRWESVAPAELVVGDRCRIAAGESVPVDGRVVEGRALVDRAIVTGESAPCAVVPGDRVLAGFVVAGAPLEIVATADVGGSTLALLDAMLRSARAARAPIERLADRFAAVLVPSMLGIAVATFAWWAHRGSTEQGVLAAVAVLVVACPCSFGIATPLALWTALARAARGGVLLRSAADLERLAAVRAVVFDKTGTLTHPSRAVSSVDAADAGILARVAAVEAAVRHPLADALAHLARDRGADLGEARDVRVLDGLGVRGRVDGRIVEVGGAKLAESLGLEIGEHDRAPGMVLVIEDGRIVARIATQENVRADARHAVDRLRALGLHVEMSTGDAAAAATRLGEELGLEVRAGCTPAEKLERIETLERKIGPTLMVGDGVNDGPALSRAAIGASVSGATSLARAVAAVNVLGDDLGLLAWSVELSRRALLVVRQNLAWAVGYNAGCVVLAASGYLPPVVAAVAMLASSATVVLNSLRLARIPLPEQEAAGGSGVRRPVMAAVVAGGDVREAVAA